MRGDRIKKIIIGILFVLLIILIGLFVFFKFFANSDPEPQETLDPVESAQTYVNVPEHKVSFLFRDGILGKDKADVCEVLDIEPDEIISENIFSTNMTTSYKWNGNKLQGIMSTVETTDGVDYDFARSHQVLVDSLIDSTGKIPTESKQQWEDGTDHKFSSATWNKALESGELKNIYDRFRTDDGDILIITCNKKLDEAIDRSRTEKIFQTIIVGDSSYIDSFLKGI